MNWKDAWGWRECFEVSPPMEGEIVPPFRIDESLPIGIPGEVITDRPISKEVSDRALDEVEQAFREVFGDEAVQGLEDDDRPF